MSLRLCLLLCLVLTGCSNLLQDRTVRRLGRTGMQGAVAGMQDSKAELRLLLREVLLDPQTLQQIAEQATTGMLNGMSGDAQRARVAALVAALIDSLSAKGDEAVQLYLKHARVTLEETLEHVAENALAQADRSIKEILHKDLVEASTTLMQRNADTLSRALAAQLEGKLGESLERTSGRLARNLVAESLSGLQDERSQKIARAFMREAMRDAVLGMGDGFKQGLRDSSTEAALIAGVIGMGTLLLLLGGCLWFFVRHYYMSSRALTIIAQKINQHGQADSTVDTKALKRAIAEGAERNNVHGWLSSFLKGRGL